MLSKRTILVTGGAGFVGSNLCKELLRQGKTVDCVDNLITGRREAIEPHLSHQHFRFFQADITDSSFLTRFLGTRYDEIYHLACPTGVPNIKVYGEEMMSTCSTGTEHVLQLARVHGAKVVYTSSAESYGNPEVFPQSEDYCGNVDPVGPRSAYEEGKRYGEALVKLYVDKYQLDAKVVRIFNTFGVGMSPHDQRVMPQFIKKTKEGTPVVVYGDGSQTRTYLYVDDLLAGLQTVMDKGHRGEVYNIGGEEQLSIMALVELLQELTPLPVEVEHRPHFIEDHRGRRPMLAKIKALGWQPRVKLADGLRRMLASCGVPVKLPRPAPQAVPASRQVA